MRISYNLPSTFNTSFWRLVQEGRDSSLLLFSFVLFTDLQDYFSHVGFFV